MRPLLVVVLFVVCDAHLAAAQWDVVREPVSQSAENEIPVALIENDSGHSLRIYVDDNGTVRGIFGIRDGFDALAWTTCPTYRIDTRQPIVVSTESGSCDLEPKRAHFVLGKQVEGAIESTQLHRLMNGKLLVFRYHLDSVGYRETSFSLQLSKFAVEGAVGRSVNIVKDETP